MTPLPGGSGKPPDGEHFPTRCCFPAAGTGSPPRSTLLRPWSVRAADKSPAGHVPPAARCSPAFTRTLSPSGTRPIRTSPWTPSARSAPNEGARKVYIFPDCTILTEQDQNVLLKIVEEGPPYAAFLFCAENSSVVLQTLRSRCVELKLHPAVTVEKESSEAGVELCRLLAAGKRGTVTELMVRLEKKRLDRDGLAAMLDQARTLLAAALLAQYGQSPEGPDAALVVQLGKRLTKQRIMGTIELLQTYRGACSYNVGASHVLGALAVELEEIL